MLNSQATDSYLQGEFDERKEENSTTRVNIKI